MADPGLPCDYLREAHSFLADHGFRVVTFDQLGTGKSDRPTDESLWSITRYVEEVETIRTALDLGKVHLLGHSWGGWLAIEYAVHHGDKLKTLLLEDTVADMPHLISELERLRGALGSETIAMMQRHEAQGTITHPEYMAAITLLNYRHVCRLEEWPAPVKRSLDDWNMGPYMTMQGPNEFLYTGNLKDWNRVPDLHAHQGSDAHHLRPARRADAGLRAAHEAAPAERGAEGLPEFLAHAVLRGAAGLLPGAARFPEAPPGLAIEDRARTCIAIPSCSTGRCS